MVALSYPSKSRGARHLDVWMVIGSYLLEPEEISNNNFKKKSRHVKKQVDVCSLWCGHQDRTRPWALTCYRLANTFKRKKKSAV